MAVSVRVKPGTPYAVTFTVHCKHCKDELLVDRMKKQAHFSFAYEITVVSSKSQIIYTVYCMYCTVFF